MRAFLLMLLIYPFSSFASGDCPQITSLTSNLYVHILSYHCVGSGGIISFTNKIDKNGKPVMSTRETFKFEEECKFSKAHDMDEFSCHANGRTPLTGATYKREQFGTYIKDCGEIGEPHKMPRMRYVCKSGCSESAPKYLDQVDPCD